jgi:hypothetical protein
MAVNTLGFPTAGYPGPYSGYLPNTEATKGLLVGYSRNKNTFPIMSYVEMFPTSNMFGAYQVYTSRNAARILTATDLEHIWAIGEARPPGLNELESAQTVLFKTVRRAYPFTIGEETVEQNSYNVMLTQAQDMAQKAMTARTMLAQAALAGAAWGTSNSSSVQALIGANLDWSNGSTGTGGNNGYNIKVSLQYGIRTIHQQTIGAVREQQLALIINPITAQAMAQSPEIQDYIKQDVFALGQLMGNVPNQNGIWGLPTHLYGVRLIVEDAVRVSSNIGAVTDTLTYVMPTGVAYLLATPGELMGLAGNRSWSTLQMFVYRDEMTVETLHDVPNRRFLGSVVSNYFIGVVSTLSAFQFTGCCNPTWPIGPPA